MFQSAGTGPGLWLVCDSLLKWFSCSSEKLLCRELCRELAVCLLHADGGARLIELKMLLYFYSLLGASSPKPDWVVLGLTTLKARLTLKPLKPVSCSNRAIGLINLRNFPSSRNAEFRVIFSWWELFRWSRCSFLLLLKNTIFLNSYIVKRSL